MKVVKADFVKSGTQAEHFPDLGMPEVAFGGRSNVGKSSLINSLVARKKLVKVSKTPGRTQMINFFNVNDVLCLVDLPGFGYAKVPKGEKRKWGPMIENYLTERQELLGIVIIMDLRRGAQEDDKMLIQAAPQLGFKQIIVFT